MTKRHRRKKLDVKKTATSEQRWGSGTSPLKHDFQGFEPAAVPPASMAAFAMATAQAQVASQIGLLSLDISAQAAAGENGVSSVRFTRSLKPSAFCSGVSSSRNAQLPGFGATLAGTPIQVRRSSEKTIRSVLVQAAAFEGADLEDDDWDEETEEEVQAAYEELYGKAFGGGAAPTRLDMGKDDEVDVQPAARVRRGRGRGSDDTEDPESRAFEGRRGKDEFEERLIQVRRVTKVVKGGKQLAFRTVVVVGDRKGKVGVGVGKAKEVIIAVQKAGVDARRHMVVVPMTKYLTFPHRANGRFGAATVMLRPAAIGTGVIAGGAVRVVLELAGVENALGKELGSGNPLNNARAVLDAVSNMKQLRDVARLRGIPMEELWK